MVEGAGVILGEEAGLGGVGGSLGHLREGELGGDRLLAGGQGRGKHPVFRSLKQLKLGTYSYNL